MNEPLMIVLGLLGVAMIMFAINKPRMDAVGLIMIFTLPLTGVINVEEALSGFADTSVILIALLFVVGESLARTGVVQVIGDWLVRKSNASETRLLVFMMVTVAGIGSFMSSTGVVALFIPIVVRIAKRSDIPVGRLMMPLAYAALLSGMMTLVATPPNLIIQGELMRHGPKTFSFFSFLPFGIPLLLLAIPYMYFARRFLGNDKKDNAKATKRPQFSDWIEQYNLNHREVRIRIQQHSPLVGKTLAQLDLRQKAGINILAVERHIRLSKKLIIPQPDTILQPDDILLLDIINMPKEETIANLCNENKLTLLKLTGRYFSDSSQQLGMAETMVPAGSRLVGRNIIDLEFRNRYDLTVLGLKRGQKALDGNIIQKELAIGDVLLLIGPWRAIRRLQTTSRGDLLVLDLPEEIDNATIAPTRAPYAILSVILMVIMMVSGIIPNVMAALITCLLLGLFRCINLDAAYRAIHWPSLILIAGMLPFSYALQKTGGVALASNMVLSLAGNHSPHIILAALFVVTAVLGLFISNTATAVLMAPVAISLATTMEMSVLPFSMTVALAASSAFMTPVSSPVNALVVGPGQYSFFDFVKIGVPFTIIAMIVSVFLVPIIMPF